MTSRNDTLFTAAQRVIPGGVNSPVRAFRSVGGTPRFFTRGSGPRVWDADGKAYIDYVGSWGPLILGHAHPAVVQAVQAAAAKGLSFGAPTAGEVELAALLCQLRARRRAGAPGQLRHRSDDERDPARARIHRPFENHQVRGLLPRPCRRAAGQGGFGRADLRQSEFGRRAAGNRRAHAGAGLQRRRGAGKRRSPATATASPASSSSRWPAT